MNKDIHKLIHLFKTILEKQNSDIDTNPLYITQEEAIKYINEISQEEITSYYERFELLNEIFDLSPLESNILYILFLPEIEVKFGSIYAYLQNNINQRYPTADLIKTLLADSYEDRVYLNKFFLSNNSLILYDLVEVEEDGNYNQMLKLCASVKNFILQSNNYYIDEEVEAFCSLYPPNIPNKQSLSGFEEKILEGINNQKKFIINFYKYASKQDALYLASYFEFNLLEVDTRKLLSITQISKYLSKIYKEAVLHNAIIVFNHFDALIKHEDNEILEKAFIKALNVYSVITLVISKKEWKPKAAPKHHLLIKKSIELPLYKEAQDLWSEHLSQTLPFDHTKVAALLSSSFHFDQSTIRNIAYELQSLSYINNDKVDEKLIFDICKKYISSDLEHLADHITLQSGFDDIVLPKESFDLLQDIVIHHQQQHKVFHGWNFNKRFQSDGMVAIFTGSPGTGKTMAASIIANVLNLELYRIDLSKIVSKYIGETEKNLSKIFDAAQKSGVVLFFDEADAIFGKRTTVNNSNDRYANIEVSYLLQKIEEYSGLILLSTNFRKNIDEAFVRRTRFIINFPLPNEEQRLQIWEKVFPSDVPLADDIDYSYLAKELKTSGASIRNIALFSAFYASSEDRKICMEDILNSAKKEYNKIGKELKV
jgi:AAA+ superfamily predicted ATPase